jgi:hypothetical protein
MTKARIRNIKRRKRQMRATPEGSLERQMLARYRRKHLKSKGVAVVRDKPGDNPRLLNILAASELEAEGKIDPVAGLLSAPWLTWSGTFEPKRFPDIVRYRE